jgi:hypothetical protein
MLVIQEDTDLNSLPKGLLVTREIKKRERSRREKGEKSSISLAWYRQEREKREKIGMGPTYLFFSSHVRRKSREITHLKLFPILPLL